MINSFSELIGKTLLVGLTHVDEKGNSLGTSEYFGIVKSADQNHGVKVERYGVGDTVTLPPMPDAYEKARPGVYTLRSSGLQVTDPDFTCTWRIVSGKK